MKNIEEKQLRFLLFPPNMNVSAKDSRRPAKVITDSYLVFDRRKFMQTEFQKFNKPKFDLSLLPDALLGIFGIRTEHEMEHKVLLHEGRFSLRFYNAHTELAAPEKGSHKRAVDKAFDSLFSYIEGENTEAKKFNMTTPVLSRKKGAHNWDVSFYMEDQVTNLPTPQERRLSLREIPPQTFAVIRFSEILPSLK